MRFLNIVRGLRFRLTLIYVLLLFGAALMVIGLYFHQTLKSITEGEVKAALDDNWDEANGYLRIEKFRPIWTLDPLDAEDAHVKDQLSRVLLLADRDGNVLEDSQIYESIGIDSLEEIRSVISQAKPVERVRKDSSGIPYLIKAGRMADEHGQFYFFAIGQSLERSERTVKNFTREYFISLPVILVLTSLLGWALSGRALQPVNSVALAAQNITGSNLSLQIPTRGASDELDHLIESFNQMTVRLKESFEQVRRFSTDVSHELRTPLTAIRGQLEVALFTAESTEQYRDAMVNALEDVEQLSSIVRALMLLSQAESGQLALQKTSFDLGDVAEDIVDQFQIPAEEKRISLKARIEHGVVVQADRTQIERLLSNLLSNAIKYTPPAGTVEVAIRKEDTWGRIEVRDTGVGIPAENLPHIFDRFYRVRNEQTNSIQGLGLGLSFVSWIAKAHGGQVDVVSKEGEGTCFTVRLPAPESASGRSEERVAWDIPQAEPQPKM